MLTDQESEWLPLITYKTLPRIGYIALLNDRPVAAGFLRKVEGGYGQFDTFATNPYFGSQIRDKAINLVVDELISEAKSLKLHGLMCFTKDSSILSRAKARGFNLLPDSLLVMTIK